jgi:outer membrane protein assembly factor BamE (lipoprotein component of BamABCDE complex)
MQPTWIALGLCLVVAAAGCEGGRAVIKDDKTKEDRLTVGKVQGEIKVGMPASQVAELLGSPNIVTTDDKRREVWIYDKVSTDRVDTASSVYGTIIILGARSDESSSSQRQRTLTIIIKYDEEKKVRDFAYNYMQF